MKILSWAQPDITDNKSGDYGAFMKENHLNAQNHLGIRLIK